MHANLYQGHPFLFIRKFNCKLYVNSVSCLGLLWHPDQDIFRGIYFDHKRIILHKSIYIVPQTNVAQYDTSLSDCNETSPFYFQMASKRFS